MYEYGLEYGRNEKRHGESKLTRTNFKFWLSDKQNLELVNWLKDLTANGKFSVTVIEILDYVRKNGLENLKTLEGLKREKLVAEIADLKSRTAHRNKTITKPIPIPIPNSTPQTSYVPPEERKIEEIIKFSWNKYVETLRKKSEGWLITCKLCSTGFPQLPTEQEAIDRFKTHLEDSHETELLKIV